MDDPNIRKPIEYTPEMIIKAVFAGDRRALLFGETGIGKSTLARNLAKELGKSERPCYCLSADPGSPAFGIPGTVGLGRWQTDNWQLLHFEALCSLDAGRFRLPLVAAVMRLAARQGGGTLLLDAPGVTRGVGGAELLTGLAEAAAVDAVLILVRKGKRVPLAQELAVLGVDLYCVEAAPDAHFPGKRQRIAHRRRLWETYLHNAFEQKILFNEVKLTGTPPPYEAKDEWLGRQVALLSRHHTLALGEVTAAEDDYLQVRMPASSQKGDQLLVRDAGRNENGVLNSIKPFASQYFQFVPPPDVISNGCPTAPSGPRPVVHIGSAVCILVNGLFGDPLLHLRLQNQKRSLLFDLGEGSQLPAKIAHQVTDVCISHSHFDHISGFLWLLRSRIGPLPTCRLYGPPGLVDHIDHLINGILWDRVGEWGPRFEVHELHGNTLQIWNIQAGRKERGPYSEREIAQGVLHQEASFTIRAITLDHGTPVLAYTFEQGPQLKIRKDHLAAGKFRPGPWLKHLKFQIGAGNRQAIIDMPDGTSQAAGTLADHLLISTPGEKMVYATDLADTPSNREKLITMAHNAHTLFCEAAFAEADASQASQTGHLTTRACGEIAAGAGVNYLVPFHFSKRYTKSPGSLYDEIKAVCSQVVIPRNEEVRQRN